MKLGVRYETCMPGRSAGVAVGRRCARELTSRALGLSQVAAPLLQSYLGACTTDNPPPPRLSPPDHRSQHAVTRRHGPPMRVARPTSRGPVRTFPTPPHSDTHRRWTARQEPRSRAAPNAVRRARLGHTTHAHHLEFSTAAPAVPALYSRMLLSRLITSSLCPPARPVHQRLYTASCSASVGIGHEARLCVAVLLVRGGAAEGAL